MSASPERVLADDVLDAYVAAVPGPDLSVLREWAQRYPAHVGRLVDFTASWCLVETLAPAAPRGDEAELTRRGMAVVRAELERPRQAEAPLAGQWPPRGRSAAPRIDRRTTMASTTSSPAGTDVRIRGLSHFTLPVRDRYAAARFYTAIFNCELAYEADPERVRKGLSRSLDVGVRLCEGIVLDLFEQDYGQPAVEQAHPHHAFEVAAEDVAGWLERLRYWQVPFVGPIARGGASCEIYFRDPDGNQLELNCHDYPADQRVALPRGPHDHRATVIAQWPTPERAAEADRQLAEKLVRLRAQPLR